MFVITFSENADVAQDFTCNIATPRENFEARHDVGAWLKASGDVMNEASIRDVLAAEDRLRWPKGQARCAF